MADFDLTGLLKEGAIPDLTWLDVDEEEYRKQDTLPKQNLDIRPDLEALWAHDDKPATAYLVPNQNAAMPGADNPHTMGDMSEAHGHLRARPEDIIRVARLALVQSDNVSRLRSELVSRFGIEELQRNREVLASVLAERGVLGRFYIDANDFPNCARGGKDVAFATKFASSAKYVRAKTACGGCCHARETVGGAHQCGQFQKELRVEVPFTEAQAVTIEEAQRAKGREIQASTGLSAKERIRRAYLAPKVGVRDEKYAGAGLDHQAKSTMTAAAAQEKLIDASSLVRSKKAKAEQDLLTKPVVAFVHREMLKGRTHSEVASGLKLAFDRDTLLRSRDGWAPLLAESGMYGVLYTKQASFEDCNDGAEFLAKYSNGGIRAVVAGEKCSSCVYNKGRCMIYGKPLVKSAAELVTPETVNAALADHFAAGRLPTHLMKMGAEWGATPEEAFKRIHRLVTKNAMQTAPERLGAQEGFYGAPRRLEPAVVKRVNPVVKQAAVYMNDGLFGEALLKKLKAKYMAPTLVAAQQELRTVLAEQGLQGHYYIDPAVYDDYGTCDQAASLYRARSVPYVKLGSKCASCVHQVDAGVCSKLKKPLVNEPPYQDKRATQRAILASAQTTPATYASLVNNGTSVLSDFQMNNPMDVAVDAEVKPASPMDVKLAGLDEI